MTIETPNAATLAFNECDLLIDELREKERCASGYEAIRIARQIDALSIARDALITFDCVGASKGKDKSVVERFKAFCEALSYEDRDTLEDHIKKCVYVECYQHSISVRL